MMFENGPLKLLFAGLFLLTGAVVGRYDPERRIDDAAPGWPSPPPDGWIAFGAYLAATLGWVPVGPAVATAFREPEKGLLLLAIAAVGAPFFCYWWQPGLRVAFGFVGAGLLFLAATISPGPDESVVRLVRGFAAGGAVFVGIGATELLRRAVASIRRRPRPEEAG